MNKTNVHITAFALGLALKQRRKASRKSPINITKWTWTSLNKYINAQITVTMKRSYKTSLV